MTLVILLDSGPLGLVTNPKANPENTDCNLWLDSLLDVGHRVIIPAIVDYEVRRELLRADKRKGLERLDAFLNALEFLPLTPQALTYAAMLWADVRKAGKPTSDDKALDGDVILAAQALTLNVPATDLVIATTNVGHLGRFLNAEEWRNILP